MKRTWLDLVFLEYTSFFAGTTILCFLFSILIINSIGFLCKLPVLSYSIPFAGLASLIYAGLGVRFVCRVKNYQPILVFIGLVTLLILVVVISFVMSNYLLETSWDGLSYHSFAINALVNGWNPIRGQSLSGNGIVLGPTLLFPKGSWIYEAAFYRSTGIFDLAKAPNFLLMFSSFFLTLAALLSLHFRSAQALLLAGLAALNPVTVTQIHTLYVDGQLASLLVCLMALFLWDSRKRDQYLLGSMIWIFVLLVNVKLTGLVYALVFYGGWFGFLIFDKLHPRAWLKFMVVTGIGLLLGIGLVGFNPYITNTIYKSWPSVQNTIAIEVNTPENLRGKSSIVKLGMSLFSRTQSYIEPVKIKLPFRIYKQEFRELIAIDTRAGGFGPLFSGILLFSVPAFFFGLFSTPEDLEIAFCKRAILWLLALTIISILVNPESWWARYAPQIWLIPILCVMMLGLDYSQSKLHRFFRQIVLYLVCLNLLLVISGHYYYYLPQNQLVHKQLQTLALQSQPVQVEFGIFVGNKMRFDDLEIHYLERDNLDCSTGYSIPHLIICGDN